MDNLMRATRRCPATRWFGLCVSAALALSLQALDFAGSSRAADCTNPTSVGVDTTGATCGVSIYLGHATGQTFFAADTVITAITAWRHAVWDTNFAILRIHILGLDEFGTPDPKKVIQDGPTVQIPYSPIYHRPTPYRFAFDPPVVLPGPGEYEFAIQGDQCAAFVDMAANCNDPYPLGRFWDHGRVLYPPCHLARYPLGDPTWDMVFSVEFCGVGVPTQRQTWGEVKAVYR
jgi:hypothetical protein